jgi:hypothetical protein
MGTHSLHIGDCVIPNISIDWVDNLDNLIITDIKELGKDWFVAVVNATYSQSDGKLSNHILLENLKKDFSKTRDLIIDQLLDPEQDS